MKYIIVATAFAFAAFPAEARINCNHDPVCQAKRDGRTVAESARMDRQMTACLGAVGYTQEDWRAYRVPAGPADKVRSCFRKHGLPQ